MAIAGRWHGGPLQQARLRAVRLQRLRPLRRRRHDGGHLAARPPRSPGTSKLSNLCWIYDNNHITIEGNTDLAFSEDVATRFLGYGWNVTRVGDANDLDMLRRAFQAFQGHRRPADAHHRRQPHRLRRAQQAGHRRRPRRAARRGRDPAGQADLRLARGRQVPRPRRRLRALRRGHRQARQGAARRLVRAARRVPEAVPRAGRRSSTGCSTASSPTAGTRTCPTFPADAKGLAARESSGKVLNAVAKNVPWLIGGAGRPGPLDQDPAHLRRRRRLRGRQLRRPQPPLRHPRARDGGHPQRHGAVQGPAASAPASSSSATTAGRRSASPRSWRSRSSTSSRTTRSASARTARRTSRSSSSPSLRAIPGLHRDPPGRRQRGGRGLAGHHAAAARAGRCWSSPGRTSRRSTATKYAPARGLAKGAYVLADADGGKPDVHPDRHRQRGLALRRGATRSSQAEGIKARVVSMPSLGAVRAAGPRSTATRSCRPRSRPASRSSRRPPSAGSSTSAPRAPGSACVTFGASAPLKDLLKKFGFTVDHVVEAAHGQLAPAL